VRMVFHRFCHELLFARSAAEVVPRHVPSVHFEPDVEYPRYS
jgi:hypothetical protein